LYFVKYLKEFGINPIVVTVPESGGALGKEDQFLLKELPENTDVVRIECFFKNHSYLNKITEWVDTYFSLVEKHGEAWLPFIKKAMPGLIDKYKPATIYVTIPPFSMAPLWVSIGKKYKLPVILDFRDGWSQWVSSPYASRVHYKALLSLEARCINNAAAVICTSNEIANDLKQVHAKLKQDKITVITNGFDRQINTWKGLHVNKADGKFVIGYVGSFYYSPESMDDMFKPWWKKPIHRMLQYSPRKEDWKYRSPYFFFRAVAALISSNPEYKDKLIIRFAGIKPDWISDQIATFGLEQNCEFVGFLKYDEVIGFQQNCDALLITSSKVINGRDYSIAGKTFDYFTIAKPILAFVCEGAQKDILEPSGICVVCNPDEPVESAKKVKSLMEGAINLKPSVNYIEQFRRRNLTEKLATVIKNASTKNKIHQQIVN
jgi:glycosyltransferase involved in cell wall biosynthesis